MEAAGRRDRAGWLSLFAHDGRVEDPVGSTPHVGRAQIGRFYDTFIGPREITFESRADFVEGATVVRDLTLNVRMSAVVALQIPAVLVYQLDDGEGGLKIRSLQAYWELAPMMAQFGRKGPAALPAGLSLSRALLANQGVQGALGFARGFRRPGRAARAVVADLIAALTAGDELSTRRILGPGAKLGTDPAVLGERLRGAHASKILAAGRSMTVSLTAGRSEPRGLLIIDFADDAGTPRISGLRFFG